MGFTVLVDRRVQKNEKICKMLSFKRNEMKMIKKIIMSLLCLCSLLLFGCSRNQESVSISETDPIRNYDSVEKVRTEGEWGSFTVSKKLYVSDSDNIPFFDLGRGGWVNKGRLAVIKVDNNIGRDCSIGITVTYVRSDGSEVGKSEKEFLGFSKDDSNYFFFQPEVDFDDITYEIRTLEDDTPGRSGYFTFGTVTTAEPHKLDERDTFELELFGHAANLSSSMDCSSTEKICID